MWALTACRTTDKRMTAGKQLPESCSLLAMSPADRAIHQQRLDKLCKASRLLRKTADGFEFTVDLRLMPMHDLQTWIENEQKCCSFLKMSNRILERNALAEVTVACPPEMRVEVMRTFGLRTDLEAHSND